MKFNLTQTNRTPFIAQFSAGLKRKNSNGFPSKNKVKRTESTSSLSMEACPTRVISESEQRARSEGDKKRKIKSDRPNSPSPRSVTDCSMEPYLNSYPIQMSNGSSYPQNNITTEGNATADWFNLGQPQTATSGPTQNQAPRYQLNAPATSNYTTAPAFGGTDPSQMGYTHGMDCNANTALYYQSQTYPNTLPQNNISHHIQQMDFPDPFGIGGGDLNGLDLCWLVDDMDLPDSAAEAYSSNRGPSAFESREVLQALAPCTTPAQLERAMSISGESRSDMNVVQETAQKGDSANSAFNAETSSAFGSSEAYTSYEESSLTSCTSSDDGCYDEFEVSPSHDQSIGDAMAVITNSQRRRLSKSSLALNNMYNTSTDTSFNMCDITAVEEKQIASQHQSQILSNTINLNLESGGWFRGDDEDLVLGIVEAFSS